jgi:hypothetical protein
MCKGVKEFAIRFPNEVVEILNQHKIQKKTKNSYISFNITIDNPPDYYQHRLTKKQIRKFYKFKMPLHYRQLLTVYMELDLLGRMPKLNINLIQP